MYRRLNVLALAGADLAVLLLARPNVTRLVHQAGAPRGWVSRVGTDAALATLAGAALWLVAAWLAIALLTVAASRLPGVCGGAAAWVSRRLLPHAVLRLIAGSAGLGVLLAPVAATAVPHGVPQRPHPATALPAPSWPVDPPAPSPIPAASPAWPIDEAPKVAPQPGVQSPRASVSASVRVRPGDSLWLIAARRLGTAAAVEDTAAAWPRWYAANREVIGDDPALILPGQLLRVPEPGLDRAGVRR